MTFDPLAHPKARQRLSRMEAALAAKDPGLVETLNMHVRQVLGEVVERGLAGYALALSPGTDMAVTGADENKFRVQVRSPDKSDDPASTLRTLEVSRLYVDEDGEDASMALASITILTQHGQTFCATRLADARIGSFLDFHDAFRAVNVIQPVASTSTMAPLATDVVAAVEADGGHPGPATRLLVEAHTDMRLRCVMRDALASVADLSRRMRDLDLSWGTSFLSFDQTDKHTCAIETEGQRIAFFFLDQDGMADHYAFVLALDHDAEDRPARLTAWMLYRERDEVEDVVRTIAEGYAPVDVHEIAFDVATGRIVKNGTFDDTGSEQAIWHGISSIKRILDQVEANEDDVVGTEIRTDFEIFERELDPDALDPADAEDSANALRM